MALFAQAGQLHAAHVCSLHGARSRWQETSLLFLNTSHPRRTIPTGILFLCDLCDCFSSVAATLERLEPLWAVKYRGLVDESTGSAVCETCVYQSKLQAISSVCETSSQTRRRLLAAHLPLWSFDHRQKAHQTWLTATSTWNALKRLWSLYDLPYMCKIVLMSVWCLFQVQRGTNGCRKKEGIL